MDVIIYSTNSPSNKVDKALTELAHVTGYLRDGCDVKNPEIVFKNEDASNLIAGNYIYIPQWQRYYFRKDISREEKTVRVKFKQDVLMTFKTQIRANTATVTRNENTSNGYLLDANYKTLAYDEIVTKQFPNALTQDSIVLLTVG